MNKIAKRALWLSLLLGTSAQAQSAYQSVVVDTAAPISAGNYLTPCTNGAAKACNGGINLSLQAPPFNGVGDAVWGVLDGVLTAGSTIATFPNETFTSADVGKAFIADDAGGSRNPLVTTIAGFTSAHVVTLTDPASFTAPIFHLVGVDPACAACGANTGYTLGSTQTFTNNGTPITTFNGTPKVWTVSGVAVNAGGGSGTPGTCTTLTGTTGTTTDGGHVIATGVINGGGALASVTATPTTPENYTALPSNTAQEPITGCGLVGAKLALTMPVTLEVLTTTPLYSVLPTYDGIPGHTCTSANPCPVNSTDGGTGMKLALTRFGSASSWGTDNTSAIGTLITNLNTRVAAHQPATAHIPNGFYLTKPQTTPITGYGSMWGDGAYSSIFLRIPNQSGPLFICNDCNKNGAQPNFGNTYYLSDASLFNQAGFEFRNLGIICDRLSTNTSEHVLTFKGQTQFARISDNIMNNCSGSFINVGADAAGKGNLGECWIENNHLNYDGSATNPVIDIDSIDNGVDTIAGSNNCIVQGNRIFDPYGVGIKLQVHSNANPVKSMRFANNYVEGSGLSKTGLGGNLEQFGDITNTQTLSGIQAVNETLTNPVLGFSALYIDGNTPAATHGPTSARNIQWTGTVNGSDSTQSYGTGIDLEVGQNFNITTVNNGVSGTNLVVKANVGPVNYNPTYSPDLLTKSIDATSIQSVLYPAWISEGGNWTFPARQTTPTCDTGANCTAISGNNSRFTATLVTGLTSVQFDFANGGWPVVPKCVAVQSSTGTARMGMGTPTKTSITLNWSAAFGGTPDVTVQCTD